MSLHGYERQSHKKSVENLAQDIVKRTEEADAIH